MDYCNGVEGFINYVLSIQKILVNAVLDVHVRGVKIKSFSIQMLLQCIIFYKKVCGKIFMLVCTWKTVYSFKIMVERMIWSTSSSNNMYKVVYDNSNYFKSIVIDVIRMNQSDVGECSIVDEKTKCKRN